MLQHKGAGLAPWNVENYSLNLESGQVLVDSQPLVFFHFHGFKQIGRLLCDPLLASYGVHADALLKRYIYTPYVRELYQITRWLSDLAGQPHIQTGSVRGSSPDDGIFRAIARRIKHRLTIIRGVLQGDLWVVIAGRIMNADVLSR